MKLPRIMFAAPKSGSGKTLLTCAFLQLLCEMGIDAASFKCGPDYIDPMFHKKVLKVPSKNLDSYFVSESMLRSLFISKAKSKQLSVIEGVMGLYDGLGGISEKASSYDVARITKTPIILTVDARGIGRSVTALLSGFLSYDTDRLIQGVILNKVSPMFFPSLKALIEKENGIRVLGYFPLQEEIQLESRHLGLLLPSETHNMQEKLKQAGTVLKKCMDVSAVLKIAEQASPLTNVTQSVNLTNKVNDNFKRNKIAVAFDEAFCFYYEDNLELLKENGAELSFFSPIHDSAIPEGCCGLLLGGGYPELYLRELSENKSMIQSLQTALAHHMPSLAECGGFLYLHEEMEDMDGNSYSLVGAVKGRAYYTGKPVRFGYLELRTEQEKLFLSKETAIRGHEFHYYESTANGTSCLAGKPLSARSWNAIHADKNHFWGFPHLYYYSNPQFILRFMKEAAAYGLIY